MFGIGLASVMLLAATATVWAEDTAPPLPPKSPCPGIFEYGKFEEHDAKWTGSLEVKAEYTLHGLWLRIFFDSPVEELKVLSDLFEVVTDDENKTFLLKNRDYLLKKNVPLKLEFEVHYDVDKAAPTLIGYRLNARDVCPGDRD